MIVITVTNVPPALRGDLTKWCQEVQTGVYVGRFSARIRELLWERIIENIGNGEATMIYSTNNELGYNFKTTSQSKKVIDFDGIPLLMQVNVAPENVKHGFSKAAKFHHAKVAQMYRKKAGTQSGKNSLVSLDIETTGLDFSKDTIISIGAVRDTPEENETFCEYIKTTRELPENIEKLTGITSTLLNEKGIDLKDALSKLRDFLKDSVVIGYNSSFDENFLQTAYNNLGQNYYVPHMVDIMPLVKKDQEFLDNYRLETVLKEYGIDNAHPHDALSDAQATLKLAMRLIEKGYLQF